MMYTIRAVSYTHLDVYKRKQLGFPTGWIRKIPSPNLRAILDFGPVYLAISFKYLIVYS